MIPEKLQEIMKKDGVVAIATLGPDGPHLVNTWNSYLRISEDERLFIPAGYMHKTEANIAHNPNVLITLGSSKVEGLHGPGAGFLIKGTARFVTSGPDFDFMKEKFSWLRATVEGLVRLKEGHNETRSESPTVFDGNEGAVLALQFTNASDYSSCTPCRRHR